MAISNYGELKTAVENWLSRTELVNRIPEFIALGEHRLYLDLRVRFMETTITVPIVSGTRTSALPEGFLQARSIYISGTEQERLEYRAPIEFWEIYADLPTNKPTIFTIEGENFEWGPLPNNAYSAIVLYYKKPDALSADADTNGLFTLAPNLLLYAALIETAPFLANDPRLLVWSALYDDLIDKVHKADKRDRYSGDAAIETRLAGMT